MAKQEKEQKNPQTEPVQETADTPAAEAQEKSDAVEALRAELEAAKDAHLRVLAEYDNYRKRSVREKEQAYKDSKADVLTALLPVLDNFERAQGNSDAPPEDYRKGVEMIFHQFTELFHSFGAEAYGAAGETFDPNLHSAVMHEEDSEQPENTITDVFAKGYKMGDKILRPAVVKVVN